MNIKECNELFEREIQPYVYLKLKEQKADFIKKLDEFQEKLENAMNIVFNEKENRAKLTRKFDILKDEIKELEKKE